MEKLLHSLKSPWRHGGVIAGVLDILLRLVAIFIWCTVTWFLLTFLYNAIFVEILWSQKLWQIGYSAVIFTVVTALAYTAVWDRE